MSNDNRFNKSLLRHVAQEKQERNAVRKSVEYYGRVSVQYDDLCVSGRKACIRVPSDSKENWECRSGCDEQDTNISNCQPALPPQVPFSIQDSKFQKAIIQFRECKWSYTFSYRSNEGVCTFCLGRRILDMCLMSPCGSCELSATLYYTTIIFNNPHGNYPHITEFQWNEERLKCNLVPKFVRVWKLDFHWGVGGSVVWWYLRI